MQPLPKAFRARLLSTVPDFIVHYGDLTAIFVLFALTVVADGDLFHTEVTLGSDAATQYYPFYYFLGESLRSGSIPGWNPYQFSGTPFSADPLTGGAYLPAMVLFALLPLVAAVKNLMLLHLLLAGLFTYALARALRLGVYGAFLAAVAYEYSGLFYVQNTCCLQYIGVMAWLPLAMLGAEMAIRSTLWVRRGLWWGVSGLGLSQILAAWFGQGSYYALLAVGGYVTYRTLLVAPEGSGGRGMWSQVRELFLHGGGILLFGFALGAAGVLPRLEYNGLSNLAGGYPAGIAARGGWSVEDWALVLEPGVWYVGITVAALALAAPLLARKRFAVPYFALLSLGALVLSGQGPTLLHRMLYLLPGFERLHPHSPERVLVVFYLGVALLAGAALSALVQRAPEKPALIAWPLLAAIILAATSILFPPRPNGWVTVYPLPLADGASVSAEPLMFLALAVAIIAIYALIPARLATWRGLAPMLLALVVFADLLTAAKATIAEQDLSGEGWLVRIRKTDLAGYYRPSGAARFLQSKEGEEGPFRYFGYHPGGSGEGSQVSDPLWFADPKTQMLEVNGRSMLLGLQNIQGYNPTHIARYDEFMSKLNESEQNYHFIDAYTQGLDSPLLNLLNARYIIVPTHLSVEAPENLKRFEQVEREYPTVYQDEQTKVLENREALPRAWVVHSTRQVGSEGDALELLSSNEVNPKETALLEEEPPEEEISQPEDASDERAEVTEYGADQIKLETSTGAGGLLVMSEVYYPAWKAYVDGRQVPVHATDGLLRSVALPAGNHEVEFRYESWTLRAGVAISLTACVALVALVVAASGRRWWWTSDGE